MNSLFAGSYRDKRVLITGHTGFKGAWLSLWLRELGAKVFGLALDPPTQPNLFDIIREKVFPKDRDIRADIRDLTAIAECLERAQPDFVFHLAAQPLVRESYARPLETIETNVGGTANLLEAIRIRNRPCAVVVVTSDKCYENFESDRAYKEDDPLGGHDVYSMSKAAAELVVAGWRHSFFQSPSPNGRIRVATARAGNVIGGGDYAVDRILPDAVRALRKREPVSVRNPDATRPWQHVLECLSGYLSLGYRLRTETASGAALFESAFNFGPDSRSNRTVRELVTEFLLQWPDAEWNDVSTANKTAPHEARRLNLAIDKSKTILAWSPVWEFEEAVSRTAVWYQQSIRADSAAMLKHSLGDINAYIAAARGKQLDWATAS